MWKMLYKAFCGSRGSCAKNKQKLLKVMSLDRHHCSSFMDISRASGGKKPYLLITYHMLWPLQFIEEELLLHVKLRSSNHQAEILLLHTHILYHWNRRMNLSPFFPILQQDVWQLQNCQQFRMTAVKGAPTGLLRWLWGHTGDIKQALWLFQYHDELPVILLDLYDWKWPTRPSKAANPIKPWLRRKRRAGTLL